MKCQTVLPDDEFQRTSRLLELGRSHVIGLPQTNPVFDVVENMLLCKRKDRTNK